MNIRRWIEFNGKKFKLLEGQTALDAMLRGGADLFFSCRRGTCRSCMLEIVSGDPGEASQSRLPPELKELGFFLPCVADNPSSVVARLPDLSKWVTRVELTERSKLSEGIYKIVLETERQIDWRAGQYISIRNPDGDVRSYSITSLPEDYFIEIHVQHYPDGKISDWLVNKVLAGEIIEFNGPVGTCYYSTDVADMPLVLVSTGSGAGAMLGVARDALTRNHSKQITFYHGSRYEHGLYLRPELRELEKAHPNFKAHCIASRVGEKQRITDSMLSQNPDLSGAAVFLCGNPDMVEVARVGVLRNGVSLANIFADPFEAPSDYAPKDNAKIKAFAPAPTMWDALGDGKLLTDILTDFYTQAFEDALLAPFFHKVTKQRLIEKQYAFTRDLLTGTKDYFGELPFNSHHWMIISDELFDHRERLFFSVVREYNLPEELIRQWASVNEMFRREIVKSSARGQIIDGTEHFKDKRLEEEILVDTLCDGCEEEILVGEMALLHERTGELFCQNCINM